VVLHLRAQGLEEGDEHPYALLWSMVDFTFTYAYGIAAQCHNWMTPWKNRVSSTTMKLRKSPVKPVMWQNIYGVVWFFHPRSSWTTH